MPVVLLLVADFEEHEAVDACCRRVAAVVVPDASGHGQELVLSDFLAAGFGAELVDGGVVALALDGVVVGLDVVDGHPVAAAGRNAVCGGLDRDDVGVGIG